MNTVMNKLSSRKLWTSIVGIVMGIALVFGLDEGTISTIAGAVVSLASAVTYIYTEGKIDAAALTSSIELLLDEANDISDVAED